MRVLLLALLVAGADELADARRKLLDAVENGNDTKGAEAAARLAGFDSKEAAEALLAAWSSLVSFTDELTREKEALVKTMEETGRDPKTGAWKDRGKWTTARDELAAANARLGRLEWIRLAIVGAFSGWRSDGAAREAASRLKAPAGNKAAADWGARAVAASALGRIDNPEALKALCAALGSEKEPAVRVAILDALALKRTKDPQAVAAIAQALKEDLWQVRCAAAAALRESGSFDGVTPLIEALKGAEGRVKEDVNRALKRLTGVDKHGSHDAWKAWWAAKGDAVRAGTYVPEPYERADSASGTTTFYGIPVTSKKFAFVIDRSGSMKDKAKWKPDGSVQTGPGVAGSDIKLTGDRKIDVARYELKRVLASLSDGVEFTIVFYNREVEVMSDKLVKLGKETRKSTAEYVDKAEPTGATNISDALERGLAFAVVAEKLAKSGVDTIYLLSDGFPTAGLTDSAQLRARVAEVNRLRKVAIHTIAIEPNSPSEALMRALAEENNGTYARR